MSHPHLVELEEYMDNFANAATELMVASDEYRKMVHIEKVSIDDLMVDKAHERLRLAISSTREFLAR